MNFHVRCRCDKFSFWLSRSASASWRRGWEASHVPGDVRGVRTTQWDIPVEIGPEWLEEYEADFVSYSSYVGYRGVVAHFSEGRAIIYSLDKMREGKHPWVWAPIRQLKFI